MFVFVPGQALNNNDRYEIVISKKIRDTAGTPLAKKKVVKFRTGV